MQKAENFIKLCITGEAKWIARGRNVNKLCRKGLTTFLGTIFILVKNTSLYSLP
jgi:hypothetical protein